MKFASSAIGPCSAPRDAKTNKHVRPALTPACLKMMLFMKLRVMK